MDQGCQDSHVPVSLLLGFLAEDPLLELGQKQDVGAVRYVTVVMLHV